MLLYTKKPLCRKEKWINCIFAVSPGKLGHFAQGLEGYSRDPGFRQNTVRDSVKRKIS